MEKIDRIFDMIAHPERYSEHDFDEMLADDESRKLYLTMVETNEALAPTHAPIDTESEWQRFSAQHPTRRKAFAMRRIAAISIGILMLSGITLAALKLVKSQQTRVYEPTLQEQKAPSAPDTVASTPATHEPQTAKAAIHKTFINTTLDAMLAEMASYYDVKVVFGNAEAKQLRLYYEWDSKTQLTKVIDELNQFANVNLTLDNQTITVE